MQAVVSTALCLGLLFGATVAVAQTPGAPLRTASIAPKQLRSAASAPMPASSVEETQVQALHRQIQERDRKISQLQSKLRARPATPARTVERVSVPMNASATAENSGAPQNVPYQAKAGQCYAKVVKTEGEYKRSLEKELVREAYTKIEVVPAKFAWVDEKITIEEPAEDLVRVPAQYKIVEEKTLVHPARTVWKKSGSVAGAKVLDRKTASGEILCLVEEPAQYTTVRKKVLASPEQVKRVSLPGKYKTIRVKKLVEAARESTIEVPAEYRETEKEVATKEPQYAWTRVVCETNLTAKNVQTIQLALQKRSAYRGPLNGRLDAPFLDATQRFAKERGLPHGGSFIAMEVIDALNIKL